MMTIALGTDGAIALREHDQQQTGTEYPKLAIVVRRPSSTLCNGDLYPLSDRGSYECTDPFRDNPYMRRVEVYFVLLVECNRSP